MRLQSDIVGSMLTAFTRRIGETKRGNLDDPTVGWKFAQVFCRIFTTCCFDLKVYGQKYVPREGGVLLVANHQSYLDPVLVGVRLDRPLNYIAKSELFENPQFAKGVDELCEQLDSRAQNASGIMGENSEPLFSFKFNRLEKTLRI